MSTVSSGEALTETSIRSAVLGPMMDRFDAFNEVGVVVKDLVASFLLPEVERRQVQLKGTQALIASSDGHIARAWFTVLSWLILLR